MRQKFKYLGMMATDQNCTDEKIKSRLHLRTACHHAVQNLLSFSLSSKNKTSNCIKPLLYSLFYTNVKLGPSHQGKKTN